MSELWQWFMWQWFLVFVTALAVAAPTWLISKKLRASRDLRCEKCGSESWFKLVAVEESGNAQVRCRGCGQMNTIRLWSQSSRPTRSTRVLWR